MSDLDTMQAVMARALRKRRALTKDPEIVALARAFFTGSASLSPVEQLEIYRQQFWLRHTSALLEDFPGVSGILGQQHWERLAEEYLEAHPPTTFDLRDVGERLPDFIAHHAEWLPQRGLVADMARLEWAYVEVFDAADAPPLAPEKLVDLPPEAWPRLRLTLNPAVRLLRVAYPVVELRRQLCPPQTSPVPNPAADARRLLVHRSSRDIRVEALEEVPFRLLEAVADGAALAGACESALSAEGAAGALTGARLQAWFHDWVRRAIVVDVSS